MDDVIPFPSGYTAAQAAKLLELSIPQIRGFVEDGFVEPRRGDRGEYRFSFQDLVLLRTAKELTQSVPSRKVKRALRGLRDQLPQGRALSGVRITAEGDQVVVRDEDALWNAESGQTLLDFEVAELAAGVAPLVRDAARAARDSGDSLAAADWYELGCDLEMSEPDEAVDAYRRALELDPRHADAHVNLGRLLHEAGELRGAEVHYRLALAARPEDPTAAYNLGVCLQDRGNRGPAIEAYALALRGDPENADAHFNLAQLLEETGRPEEALRHLQSYRGLVETSR
jgi:tetratricopeptide (TPR) repeat protein